ncbi:ABC transporter permease [Intestinibacter bartlettii]|uniref:ABC transporter permease n=1 Tax=Intestinibacter bartlettii TaxID=261299 RepID=A0ABS6DYK1_9FIRM|nr:ABC transporter permease [Intestinibacter bartlettii]MBU5336923.1 ABC transporter permease [Intestinibacter bartlettii]
MLRKLAIRNAKRSIKDYLIYLITVIMSFSLIIAFNLIVYSKDVRELSSMMINFRLAVIEVSVLVVFVIGWLINYTMKFMLSKRSKEFGTYMILGIERKDIIKMFLIENIFLGIFAFVVSMLIGYILSDLLTAVIMNIFEVQYKLNFSISWQPFALSIFYFIIIYLFVMFRTNRRMKKMKVYDLLYLDKQNEERVFKNSKKKKILFVVFLIIGITALTLLKVGLYHVDDNGSIPMIVRGVPMLIISIYGITITVGDFIVDFVINRKKIKYKNDNLFITRQFTSKIKTMGVTLGTLSLLITLSFLSLAGSMMYTDMFNAQIKSIAAYDVMISEVYSDYPEILQIQTQNNKQIVEKYEKYIKSHCTIKDRIEYNIYTNKRDDISKNISDSIMGFINVDCYMKLSDYNKLLEKRGLKPITLGKNEFFIHENRDISKSIDKYLKNNSTLNLNGIELKSKGHTYENFARCWGTGMTFFIIVPDDTVSNMKILDRFIMINIAEPTTEKLYDDICKYVENTMTDDKEKSEFYPYNLSIKGEVISENRSVLTIFSFILLYIAFIFTAIVATILAIQTLSDSTKYKYHYSILSKLGVEQSQIYKTIRKQLLIFFLFPVIYPIIIDISVITSLNGLLNPALSSEYSYLYAILYSLSLFLFIYLIYFIATYFGYKKNIIE